MQLLHRASNQAGSSSRCAADILDAVPVAIRFIRSEMRNHRSAELSLPQYRALLFVSFYQGASLSAVSEQLGLSLSATSRLIDGLVGKGLLKRQASPGDRRQMALSVTPRGQSAYRAARRATQAKLAEELLALPQSQRAAMGQSMRTLRQLLMGRPGSPTRH